LKIVTFSHRCVKLDIRPGDREREVLKMVKKIVVGAAVLFLVAGFVVAESRKRRSDTELGSAVTLQGTLARRDADWYLESGGATYELHFGNSRYLESTGAVLQEGARCTVRGFPEGQGLVVSEIELDGDVFRFRDDRGVPHWAQEGAGRSAGFEGRRRGGSPDTDKRGSGSCHGEGNWTLEQGVGGFTHAPGSPSPRW
jgi:hypothetical protein